MADSAQPQASALTQLGNALEQSRAAAGLSKTEAARRMNSSRTQWDRILRDPQPSVDAVRRAATAAVLDERHALELAGYDPDKVAATRPQPEQQQKAVALAG